MTLQEEINKMNDNPQNYGGWEAKQSHLIQLMALHIDNIENTLKYLVDKSVKEKYGK